MSRTTDSSAPNAYGGESGVELGRLLGRVAELQDSLANYVESRRAEDENEAGRVRAALIALGKIAVPDPAVNDEPGPTILKFPTRPDSSHRPRPPAA